MEVKLILSVHKILIKGEVRSWSNLIWEERVKFSEQNSENLMKIGWKIRKLWNFEVSQIFRKHFLTSPYEYANEWVDDVIASQFSIHFVHRNDKNFIFQLWECLTWLNYSLNRCRIMLKPKYSFGKWWKWKISLMGIVHKSCTSSQSPVNLFVRNHQFS